MAKILQGILGGVSGKISSVVGSSWKGIPVIKAKPLSVANPRTAAQMAQRDAFSSVIALATQILASIIKPLWDRFAIKQSGYNAFVSANIANFDASGPSDYSLIKMSKGKMEKTAINTFTGTAGNSYASVYWLDDAGTGYKLSTDDAYLVLLNETQSTVATSSALAVRSDLQVEAHFDADLVAGDVLHAYLSFRRADGTVVSESSYNTVVI